MPALVSILIPCYNAERWICETLDSALAQTWPEKEIIVVNDGSKDRSREVLRTYEARGVVVIDQTNAGQSAAFNRAIASAHGDYFEFLDADDILAPDKITAQMTLAANLPSTRMISGAWARFYNRWNEVEIRPDLLSVPFLDPIEWLVRCWSNSHMMHGAAWLVPAHIVRQAGGWNEALSLINDFEFFARLLLHSDGVSFCPGARTFYRSNVPGSLSSSHFTAAWKSAFTSTSLGTEALLARENSPRTRTACAAAWRQFYYDSYPCVPELRLVARDRIVALGETIMSGPGGPRFRFLARIIGWENARRIQLLFQSRLRLRKR